MTYKAIQPGWYPCNYWIERIFRQAARRKFMNKRLALLLFTLLPALAMGADIVPIEQNRLEPAQTIAMKPVEALKTVENRLEYAN